MADIKKLVYTSSATVVIDQDNYALEGVDETMPYAPKHLDLYTITKHAAEEAVLASTKSGSLFVFVNGLHLKGVLETAILRPACVFGMGMIP